MRLQAVVVVSVLLVGASGVGMAQAPGRRVAPAVSVETLAQPGGTVTGHVYCGDTQRPARFASVELLREDDPAGAGPAGSRGGLSYQSVANARTGLDGSFRISGVPAGDYFVAGTMTGYVSAAQVARVTRREISGVPKTHVEANGSSDVVVSMERGAVVSGRVTFDDGSPLAGAQVSLRSIANPDTLVQGRGISGFGRNLGFAQSDDRGYFRVAGVPPGIYNLVANVQTEVDGRGQADRSGFRGSPATLTVFAPTGMRRADARTVEVHGGETIDGVDILVALNGLRTLRGTAQSKADGHALNAGMVFLNDTADSSITRVSSIDSEGAFRLEYLPAGTYSLTVQGEDRPTDGSARPGRGGGSGGNQTRYERATVAVTVGDHDVTVDAVQLDEVKSSASAQP